jgi:hypothetical protein
MALLVGGFLAVLAWTIPTCTGGVADSLISGPILAVPTFFFGWLLVPKHEEAGLGILGVATIPAILMALVAFWTMELASGRSACNLITGLPFGNDGREGLFVALWTATCLIFFGGLVVSLRLAGRKRNDPVE